MASKDDRRRRLNCQIVEQPHQIRDVGGLILVTVAKNLVNRINDDHFEILAGRTLDDLRNDDFRRIGVTAKIPDHKIFRCRFETMRVRNVIDPANRERSWQFEIDVKNARFDGCKSIEPLESFRDANGKIDQYPCLKALRPAVDRHFQSFVQNSGHDFGR